MIRVLFFEKWKHDKPLNERDYLWTSPTDNIAYVNNIIQKNSNNFICKKIFYNVDISKLLCVKKEGSYFCIKYE